MKFIRRICWVILLAAAPSTRSQAQILDAIKAAIIAADIAVQKVQNATITLQNIQKQIENELSRISLGEIGNWEQQFKDLYIEYYDELKQVKNVIRYYHAISGIIIQQGNLVSEYRKAFSLIRKDPNFSAADLDYITRIYNGIIEQSIKSVDQIALVLSNYSLQMSDAARLQLIEASIVDIQRLTSDLRSFTSQTAQIAVQRAKSKADLRAIMNLYGF